jgi:hypothetical protein
MFPFLLFIKNMVRLRSEKQCESLSKEVLTTITSIVKNNTCNILHDIFKQ